MISIIHQIIKTNTGTDKFFFYLRKFTQFSKQFNLIFMVYFKVLTRGWKQTLSGWTCTFCHLLFAGRRAEIRRRTAHVMNISFEIGIFRQFFRFLEQRFLASRLHDSALMEGQRAEITCAKAPAHRADGEFDFTQRRNAALRFIGRMLLPCIRQRIYFVQFFGRQRHHGRILHQIPVCILHLTQRAPAHGILMIIFL